jgi:hypothetical protein
MNKATASKIAVRVLFGLIILQAPGFIVYIFGFCFLYSTRYNIIGWLSKQISGAYYLLDACVENIWKCFFVYGYSNFV